MQLKQSTCEAVMILRSRFLDARCVYIEFASIISLINDNYYYMENSSKNTRI
jgi:hypothetical protein